MGSLLHPRLRVFLALVAVSLLPAAATAQTRIYESTLIPFGGAITGTITLTANDAGPDVLNMSGTGFTEGAIYTVFLCHSDKTGALPCSFLGEFTGQATTSTFSVTTEIANAYHVANESEEDENGIAGAGAARSSQGANQIELGWLRIYAAPNVVNVFGRSDTGNGGGHIAGSSTRLDDPNALVVVNDIDTPVNFVDQEGVLNTVYVPPVDNDGFFWIHFSDGIDPEGALCLMKHCHGPTGRYRIQFGGQEIFTNEKSHYIEGLGMGNWVFTVQAEFSVTRCPSAPPPCGSPQNYYSPVYVGSTTTTVTSP